MIRKLVELPNKPCNKMIGVLFISSDDEVVKFNEWRFIGLNDFDNVENESEREEVLDVM